MSNEIKLKTRDWEELLTYTQQKKYRAPIAQGWFADYHGIGWRHETFYGAYIWKYPKYFKVVRMFANILGHKPTWDDLTDDNLRDLFEEITNNYAPNSARTLFATIKAVIRENDPTRHIPSQTYHKVLRMKQVPVQAVYLTEDEIDRIIKYHPRGKNKRYVQRMFIMECLCGARLSDCERMTTENIDDTGRYLVYVAQKTKTVVKVPLHKKLRAFLVCGTGDDPKDGISDKTFNRLLRDMCYDCGIDSHTKVFTGGKERSGKKYTFVSSHTGRRSFATNLSKKGVSLEQIAVMMGHTSHGIPNTKMTEHYIVSKTEIDSNTLKLFGIYDNDYLGVESEDE